MNTSVLTPGVRYMLLSTLVFSIMFALVKTLDGIPPVEIVLFRCVISLTICVATLQRQRVSLWGSNHKVLLLRGAFGSVGLILSFITLQSMPLASAQTVLGLAPIFTVLIAWQALGERLYRVQWLFFLIIFGGVLLIKGFDPRVSWLNLATGIGAAFAAGCAYNCVRLLKNTEHPLVIVFYFPLITTPIAATVSYFYWVTPVGVEWLQLLGVGLLTQVAQVYMTKALQNEEANKVASIKYTSVIYALAIGYIFFHEAISWAAAVGIALVVGGVMLNISTKGIVRKLKAA